MDNNLNNQDAKKEMPLGTAFCKIIGILSRSDKAEKIGNRLALSRGNLAKAVILVKNKDIGLTLEEKEAWKEFVRQMSWSFYERIK